MTDEKALETKKRKLLYVGGAGVWGGIGLYALLKGLRLDEPGLLLVSAVAVAMAVTMLRLYRRVPATPPDESAYDTDAPARSESGSSKL